MSEHVDYQGTGGRLPEPGTVQPLERSYRPPVDIIEQRRPAPPARRRRSWWGRFDWGRLGDRLAESGAILFALAIAGGLWYAGASFTLIALGMLGLSAARLGWIAWCIPAGVSVVEYRWWPTLETSALRWLFWGIVSLFDAGSTLYGLITWAKGRYLALGTGVTLPSEGWALLIPAVILTVFFTYVPERITIWAVKELKKIWRS